jgi:hypothetical protein
MADTFVTKIKLETRSQTQKEWADRIEEAIRVGMSHKGDAISKYVQIANNVRIIRDEMREGAREYDKQAKVL